ESGTSSTLLRDLASRANSSFVVGLVGYARANDHQPSGLRVDFESMRSAFVSRLRDELIADGADVFSEFEYEWATVLRLWENSGEVTQYLRALLRASPQRWATLARAALQDPPESLRMNVTSLRDLLNVSELAQESSGVNLSSFEGNDRQLVEAFIRALQLVQ